MISNTSQATGFYMIRIFTERSGLSKEALEGAEHQTKLLTPKIWKELFRNELLDM